MPASPDSTAAWKIADPAYAWSFPRDHWSHPAYKTEWWYLTGQLTVPGETRPRFGYQFTVFRVGIAPGASALDSDWATHTLIMGHASLSDLRERRHLFSDVLYRDIPLLGAFGRYPDTLIAWCRGPAGTAERWTLRWNGEAFDVAMADDAQGMAFRLSTTPVKPLVLEGPNGYSQKGEAASNASQYYSFTRLSTRGTVAVGGDTLAVSGESWMDKEFGSNQLAPEQAGWDWFSLQLGDGREVMIYELRGKTGEVNWSRGTVVPRTGPPRYLEPGEWTARASGHWESPRTGTRYPSGWTLTIPSEGLDLRVVPVIPNQENVTARSSGIHYWEGAVTVDDPEGPVGRGYVELTGYGGANRPAL